MAVEETRAGLRAGAAQHDRGQFAAAVAAFADALETYAAAELHEPLLRAEILVARGKSLLRQGLAHLFIALPRTSLRFRIHPSIY